MRRSLLFCLAGLCLLPATAAAVTKSDRDVKILSGTIAAPGQFPWMVSIIDAQAERAILGAFCGGTLIAPRVVLTAAHCMVDRRANETDVVVGRTRLSQDEEGERIQVQKILIYPNYDPFKSRGDVALMQLSKPVEGILPLPIAHPADDGLISPGARVITMGWGATSEGGKGSDELLFVRLTSRSRSYCAPIYSDYHDPSELCAGSKRPGEDSCQGDSGGPVIAGDGSATRLVGAVSYGQGCGRKDIPGVYARVSYFSKWIDNRTAELNGGAIPPQPPVDPPVVRIGNIACGEVFCDVFMRTTGRPPAGGIVLNYIRRKSKGKKPVDKIARAVQISDVRWKARANLPYGNLTLYAFPLSASEEELDGDGDVQRVLIYSG